MVIREYSSRDLPEIIRIWNEVIDELYGGKITVVQLVLTIFQ